MRTILMRSGAVAAALVAMMPTVATSSEAPRRQQAKAAMTEQDIQRRIDALIAQMTPEEKAGQLTIQFYLANTPMQAVADKGVAAGEIGSLLFINDPVTANRIQRIALEQSRLKIPVLFGLDVIHGLKTIFPVPIAGAASWDPAGVEAAQAVAAREARAVGVGWTFAPMVDIARDPRWGRIIEGAGEDPYLGSAMAAAQVRGFQGPGIGTPGRIIAGPKHFVGYGAALGGRDYDEVDLSDSALWNVYLPPFQAAIDAGAGNVMSAYMGLNGIPASGNRWLLQDVLRDKLGFKGFVVSDADAVKNLKTHGFSTDPADSAARAIDAGVDMEMALIGPAVAKLPAAIAAGRISQAKVDAAVRRVLEAKFRLGLFDNPYLDEKAAPRLLGAPAHLAAARTAAERSAVLLRNDGGILPLDAARLRSIAVIGPLADSARDALGPWVAMEQEPPATSILDGIRARVGKAVAIRFEQGVQLPPRVNPSQFDPVARNAPRALVADESASIARAVDAAKAADVAVLVLGEGQEMIGESASSSTLDLPGRQQQLLDAVVATGKPVVVVLMSARPLDLKDTRAQAILDIWYPGSQAGPATANLLFGDVSPAGRLPFTWPRNIGQLPMVYARLASHEPGKADKRYWNEVGGPLYPFGHGLSYSTFAYGDVRLDRPSIAPDGTVTVSVDLKNTGTRVADEVAQLYLHQRSGRAARPVRELKGFQRVTLRPGETRTLRFAVTPAELRYWNAAVRDWVVDAADYQVAVGGSSAAPFSTSFTVDANRP